MENLFIDEKFPPKEKSIFNPYYFTSDKYKDHYWKKLVWKRPSEIYKDQNICLFFHETPHYNDIVQGNLGDCFFLSVLSSIAEFPKRIKKVFITNKYNIEGRYILRLFVNGRFKQLILDDFFPYNVENDCLEFCYSNNYDLWGMLLEKAFAKKNRCYELIQEGYAAEALTFLTGAPNKYYTHSELKSKKLWQIIKKSKEKNFIMGCHVDDHITTNKYLKLGLVESHLYSLINCFEVLKGEKMYKVIKIRNPYGYTEWKGDWSPTSKLWTKQIKEQLSYPEEDDGCFYISLKDYKKYFSATEISKVYDDFCISSKKINLEKERYKFFILKIESNFKGYISLIQPSTRKYSSYNPKYQNAFLGIMIAKLENDGQLNYIKGACEQEEILDLKLPKDFQKGNYVLMASAYFPLKIKAKIYLSIYANKNVEITESNDNSLFKKMLCSSSLKLSKPIKLKGIKNIKIYDCLDSSESNIGSITIINDSSKKEN